MSRNFLSSMPSTFMSLVPYEFYPAGLISDSLESRRQCSRPRAFQGHPLAQERVSVRKMMAPFVLRRRKDQACIL